MTRNQTRYCLLITTVEGSTFRQWYRDKILSCLRLGSHELRRLIRQLAFQSIGKFDIVLS